MKTKLLILSFFMLTTIVSRAQEIAVQAPVNTTRIYTDFNKAINEASAGSTIFLPAGSISLNDSVKITKKLTIVGVGHRPDTEGGNTLVSGNFHFYSGSDASSLMGVYLTGDVVIANADGEVNNFLLKFCNVNSVQVGNSKCVGTMINQNYLRNTSSGGNSQIIITNSILHSFSNVDGGILEHNLVRNSICVWSYNCFYYSLTSINNSLIKNNVFVDSSSGVSSGGSNNIENNNLKSGNEWGDNCLIATNWDDIFAKYDLGVNPLCDYHLKSNIGKNAGTDGTDIGIYGGTGFSDTALPPYPQIVFKNIPAQTDEFGNLKIQVKVKAQ